MTQICDLHDHKNASRPVPDGQPRIKHVITNRYYRMIIGIISWFKVIYNMSF